MNKPSFHLTLVFGAGLWLAATHPASAQGGKPVSTSASYDSFRLVHTRNVFDPDRRPFRPNQPRDNTPQPVRRQDYIALTGTMIHDDKSYAFFSGSRSDFNKVLNVSDKIADATVTQITPLNIEVEREGKRTLVAVGQTVPLDAQSVPGTPPAPDVPPPPSPGTPDATPAVAGDAGPDAGPDAPAAPASAAPVAAASGYRFSGNAGNNGNGGNNGRRRGGNNNNNNQPAAVAAAPTPANPVSAAKLEEIRLRMMKSRQQDLK